MSWSTSNFIYSKENALCEDKCRKIIEDFNAEIESGSGRCSADARFGVDQNPFDKGMYRKDIQLYLPRSLSWHYPDLQDCIFDCLEEYKQDIDSFNREVLFSPTAKVQRTDEKGGFHKWHIELASGLSSGRILGWMIYLNDVTDGGETEFLYQAMRVQPKAGTCLIWPAGVTHPHRGNPPYSNTKYVVTGWFELAQDLTTQHALKILDAQSGNQ